MISCACNSLNSSLMKQMCKWISDKSYGDSERTMISLRAKLNKMDQTCVEYFKPQNCHTSSSKTMFTSQKQTSSSQSRGSDHWINKHWGETNDRPSQNIRLDVPPRYPWHPSSDELAGQLCMMTSYKMGTCLISRLQLKAQNVINLIPAEK